VCYLLQKEQALMEQLTQLQHQPSVPTGPDAPVSGPSLSTVYL
jgi:hypothetical protein